MDENQGASIQQKTQELLRTHSRLLAALGLFFAGTFTGYLIGRSAGTAAVSNPPVMASVAPMPRKKPAAKAAAKSPSRTAAAAPAKTQTKTAKTSTRR